MNDKQQSEDLRRAALEVLASRFPVALSAAAIRRRIKDGSMVDFDCTDAEVSAALELLRGKEFVLSKRGELGASEYWQATSLGVLTWERGV